MPRSKDTKFLPAYMTEAAQKRVKEFALAQGYRSGSEYLRALIEKDMKEKGQEIDFGLSNWGGGRDKKENE